MHFGSSLFNLLEPFGVLKIVKQRKRCGTILWDELSSGVCSWGGCQRWGGPFTALLPHAERRTGAWGAPVLPCGQEKTARQRLEEGNDSVGGGSAETRAPAPGRRLGSSEHPPLGSTSSPALLLPLQHPLLPAGCSPGPTCGQAVGSGLGSCAAGAGNGWCGEAP